MPVIKRTKTVTTRTHHRIELVARDIIELLNDQTIHAVPPTAEVTFDVPGGADWSNETIEIGPSHPVFVSWTTTVTDEE